MGFSITRSRDRDGTLDARAEIDDGAGRECDVQRQKTNHEAKFRYHFIMKRIIVIAILLQTFPPKDKICKVYNEWF